MDLSYQGRDCYSWTCGEDGMTPSVLQSGVGVKEFPFRSIIVTCPLSLQHVHSASDRLACV